MENKIDRRTFLARSSACATAGIVAVRSPSVSAAESAELENLGAAVAVDAMRRGDLSAEDYAQALLARAARMASLNAFRTLDPAAVLAAARAADQKRADGGALGRLHGLPIPVKDSVDTRMMPTSYGTITLKDFRPREDAAIVERLVANGAILMGKTNLHELSFGWTSNNGSFGPVRNPYDPHRIPGGSSGGSAAAVAARIAPLAVAEDTWASIRLPAAFCGLAGLRPTYGRYPDDGIMPLTTMFDQVGPLARSVADLALFDSIAARDDAPLPHVSLPGVRVGLSETFWQGLDPEVERVARAALLRLREAGAAIVQAAVPDIVGTAPEIATTIISYEARDAIAGFLARHGAPVSFDAMFAKIAPSVKGPMTHMIMPPKRPSRQTYESALAKRRALSAGIDDHFRQNDIAVLVFPVALAPPPPIGEEVEIEIDGRKEPLAMALARNTALGSCGSMASLVLPAGLTAGGLPVGLEFATLPGSDRPLLALGFALERALGPIAPPITDAQAFSAFSGAPSRNQTAS